MATFEEPLRHLAECEIQAGPEPESVSDALTAVEAQALLHELRVHQVELEMQNEELRRAHRALEASRRQYCDLYDLAPVGYLSVNGGGIIVRANLTVTALLCTTRAALLGQPMSELVFPADWDAYLVFWNRLVDTGVPCACELRMAREDGNALWVRINAVVAEEGAGSETTCWLTLSDVTERRELEDRLHQAEKMQAIGQLAGGMAHDLNNRLTGVLGYSDMLAQRLEDATLRRYACNIRSAAKCAAALIGRLMAFARKGTSVSVATDVHQCIAEVSEILRHGAHCRIEIQQRLEADPSTVEGDPNQLMSALLNLGLNACDAMPGGGTLIIATRTVLMLERPEGDEEVPLGHCLEISVADTGTGMDAETQKHVFEPFFTTKPVGKGSGLGLASVYGIVRSHQGAIRFQSWPGRGTEFVILLPLAQESGGMPRPGVSIPVVATAGASLLLVDDESSIREAVGDMLGSLGYRVTTCASGEQAVIRYREARDDVDLVLLDMNMPGMDGRETFRVMRSINPEVRALIASGRCLASEVRELAQEGVQGVIQKPFQLADLVARVEEALQGRAPKPHPGA